ncbi:response regulator [Pseudanabaena sp. ABRG5-3]|uniref:response regulator n=1 Tax=Pseudanabaena sp. ABRG5-3 TaxID=685565 RepID=UPI000DC70766|nr:response regulator [Pseudanabaena sp. ABRG5-3]BBC24103.1 two-component response regulator [Pseudanabaena sp. ABRG5-3]
MTIESQKNIVLIDDDEHICEVVQFCVEIFSKWKVITARTGQEGLAAIALVRPDAILLDIQMPEMDGFAVLEELQANPHLFNIPVVLLTALVELTEPQNIDRLRVRGAISKPCHPTQISSQISQILGW